VRAPVSSARLRNECWASGAVSSLGDTYDWVVTQFGKPHDDELHARKESSEIIGRSVCYALIDVTPEDFDSDQHSSVWL